MSAATVAPFSPATPAVNSAPSDSSIRTLGSSQQQQQLRDAVVLTAVAAQSTALSMVAQMNSATSAQRLSSRAWPTPLDTNAASRNSQSPPSPATQISQQTSPVANSKTAKLAPGRYEYGKNYSFRLDMASEPEVHFLFRRSVLKAASEYFAGVFEDEPERTAMTLPESFNHQSGDLKMFLDLAYNKIRIASLTADQVSRLCSVAKWLEAPSIVQDCESHLTQAISSSPFNGTRRLFGSTSNLSGGSPSPSPRAAYRRVRTCSKTDLISQVSGGDKALQDEVAAINSPTLQSLTLADRLELPELKAAAIDELTQHGYSQCKDSKELHDTLSNLSKDTLTHMLHAVIEQHY